MTFIFHAVGLIGGCAGCLALVHLLLTDRTDDDVRAMVDERLDKRAQQAAAARFAEAQQRRVK